MQKTTVAIITLMLSILLTACGAIAPENGASTKLSVDMSEFMFTPGTYTIPAGRKITLTLKNSGSVEHDFTILKKGVKVKDSFDPEKYANDIVFHAKLESQQSGEYTFTAPSEAGEYQIVCGVIGHFQAGMIGSLTVVAP